MIIHVETAGPFQQNGFVVACETTKDAVIIDPGDGVGSLLAFADRESLAIRHILLTHAHIDHVTGVAEAKRALGVPVYLHRDDLFLYERVVQHGQMFGVRVEPQPPIDVFYTPGQTIAFGELQAAVHHTPGHCPGGVCLAIGRTGEAPKELFVGDTLFAGSIGRTDLPGGDYGTLLDSIRTLVETLPEETAVYPGHMGTTTLGAERATNPFLAELAK
jgi:hydroxyacylglutathione hydrolase